MQRHETTSSARAASTPRVPAKSTEELAFAAGSTELGVVLIARSVAGVCSIVMGSDDEELREGLAMRFRITRLCAMMPSSLRTSVAYNNSSRRQPRASILHSMYVGRRGSGACGPLCWASRQELRSPIPLWPPA